MLSGRYRAGQQTVSKHVEKLRAKLDQSEQNRQRAERWLRLIEKYKAIDELTAQLHNELLDKIEAHQARKAENGNKRINPKSCVFSKRREIEQNIYQGGEA